MLLREKMNCFSTLPRLTVKIKPFLTVLILAAVVVMFTHMPANQEMIIPDPASFVTYEGAALNASRQRVGAVSPELKAIYDQMDHNDPVWRGESHLLPHPPGRKNQFWQKEDMDIFKKSSSANVRDLSQYPMQHHMEPWEWQIYKLPPLRDHMKAGNETMSQMVLVRTQSVYRVGDKVTVRIDIRDGYGSVMTSGGDDVRVSVVEMASDPFVPVSSVATEVTDLKNGSYRAEVPLLWSGNLEVRACLAYNRHMIRSYSFIHNVLKSTISFMAGFENRVASESTRCLPFPVVPEFVMLCNFTRENSGIPWFCGHPRHPRLSCADWKRTVDLKHHSLFPWTKAEAVWFNWLNKHPFHLITKPGRIVLKVLPQNDTVNHNFHRNNTNHNSTNNNNNTNHNSTNNNNNNTNHNITNNKNNKVDHISGGYHNNRAMQKQDCDAECRKESNLWSWGSSFPRGYFYKRVWIPLDGHRMITARDTPRCLANTTVLLIGDSNQRILFGLIQKRMGCTTTLGKVVARWHKPLECKSASHNFSMRWRIHPLPFHFVVGQWGELKDQVAMDKDIENIIHSTGRYVIAVNINIHLNPFHYSVLATQMRAVRVAVERALKKNPEVRVIIRGPHVIYTGWPKVISADLIAPRYTDIIKRAFAGLYDKVAFFQPWDMTIASQNRNHHPDAYVNDAMASVVLGHIC